MSKIAEIKIRSRSMGYRAFTLIELLIVVTVISLLLGILLLALSRSKAIAKQTVCQSRLRQWGLAFEMYAADNDYYYPHIDGRDRCGDEEPITPFGKADYYFGWVDVLPPMIGEKPWRDHDNWQHPGTNTIFQCPSAKLAPEASYKYKPRRNGYFSYAMNSCLELDKNCWPPNHPYIDPTGGTNDMPSFLRTTTIRNPYRVILLFDQLLDPEKGYGGKIENPTAGKHCGSYPKAFSARHAKPSGLLGGSVLYCDYRVQWTETVWKPQWPDDLEVPPRYDLDWYPYP